jgi:hypothetical protein
MSEEDGPKSAIELAMERLQKEDAEAEVTTRKLTDEEKTAIAEVRSLYDSRIAEASTEVPHRLSLAHESRESVRANRLSPQETQRTPLARR